MKKITMLVMFLTLVLIVSSCGAKKAERLKLQNTDDIESVKIEKNNQNFEIIESDAILELVKQIGMGEPTAKESVQDVPNVTEYVKIDFFLKNNITSTLFIYQEKNKWYIEQPYQGIYIANDDLIETIDNME